LAPQHNDGSKHPQSSRILVKTDGDTDPFDPRNWPLAWRSKNIAILAFLIFTQAWAGAADSIANSVQSKEFHVSTHAQNLTTAMYLFGVGTSCLFVGSISETTGRNPTYLVSTFLYLFFVLGTALAPNFGGYIVCRYFIGLFAGATLGINGASVKDQFHPVKRAGVFPVIAWVNVVPPVLAPVAGGWILADPTLSMNWRWMQWITLILSGFAFLLAFLFLPETYLPILLNWKAQNLRQITGDNRFYSEHAQSKSFLGRLKTVVPLSIKFLAEPVIVVLGSYLVLLYILLFTFLSGFEYIFKKTYTLSNQHYGSCFGSIAVGATLFTMTAPGLFIWARRKTEYKRRAKVTPEFRLWPAVIAAPFLPISLFWLGWTNYADIPIWSGLAACAVFGAVLIALYVCIYEYIIDTYASHAAVALAMITMVRYLIAGGMVLAARQTFEAIGVHWTLTLLGSIAAVLTPGPFMLHRYGQTLRKRSKYAQDT